MADGDLDQRGLTSTIPASLAPVGWLEGVAWPTIGALVCIGVIVGLDGWQSSVASILGHAGWTFAFGWPVLRWFTRPVRNRRLAAWSGALMWIALTGVLGVWLWASPLLDDWRWSVIQTGTVWLAVITFVVATHVRTPRCRR